MIRPSAKIFLYFLIASVSITVLTSCDKPRTPVSYELPKDFSGWVTVKYEKKDAPELKPIDGRYSIKISKDGFAETSSRVETGTASDEYYWMDGDKKFVLPLYTEDKKSMMHGDEYISIGFQNFVSLDTLPVGKEVTLPDGGKVTKLDDKGGVSFKSGRPLMFKFYISKKPEDLWDFPNNRMPPTPKEHETY